MIRNWDIIDVGLDPPPPAGAMVGFRNTGFGMGRAMGFVVGTGMPVPPSCISKTMVRFEITVLPE